MSSDRSRKPPLLFRMLNADADHVRLYTLWPDIAAQAERELDLISRHHARERAGLRVEQRIHEPAVAFIVEIDFSHLYSPAVNRCARMPWRESDPQESERRCKSVLTY